MEQFAKTTKEELGEIPKPNHVAFIMDGNGRWAQARGLSRSEGHKNAEKAIKTVVECGFEYGLKEITLFAFSTENWSRSEEEKNTIFGLLEKFLAKFKNRCIKNEIRVKILGDIEPFKAKGLHGSILEIEKKTKDFQDRTLNIALNYGGRQEIISACNKAVEIGKRVSEEDFSKLLYTNGGIDPDFIVRTSGEQRLSNFLLYQSAYSELYFPECFWPDFDKEQFDIAMGVFASRKRRFGKI